MILVFVVLNNSGDTFSIIVTTRDAFAEDRILFRGELRSCRNRSNLDNSDDTQTRLVDKLTGLRGVVWPVPAFVTTASLMAFAAGSTRARSDNAVGSTSTSVPNRLVPKHYAVDAAQ